MIFVGYYQGGNVGQCQIEGSLIFFTLHLKKIEIKQSKSIINLACFLEQAQIYYLCQILFLKYRIRLKTGGYS